MGEYRKKYDEDFKKNAVKLSYASPKSVKEIADDLGIHENLLYNWRRKYTAATQVFVFFSFAPLAIVTQSRSLIEILRLKTAFQHCSQFIS